MKKSEFTSFIKEEIVNILSEDNHDEKSILAKAKAQAELNKDRPWYQDLLGFVFEWTINLFLPGVGTAIVNLYEWD